MKNENKKKIMTAAFAAATAGAAAGMGGAVHAEEVAPSQVVQNQQAADDAEATAKSTEACRSERKG